MIKMRRLEEIREARLKEQEKRERDKRGVLEGKMEEVKSTKKRRKGSKPEPVPTIDGVTSSGANAEKLVKKKRKSVAFA